jgi:Tol biopolymer transport system component
MATPDPSRNSKLWALGVQPAGEFVKYDFGSKRFVSLLPGISGTDLDVSRDGKWVAYVDIPRGTLWRCRIDGGDCLELTKPSQQTALPRWSPDGKQIAFMSVEIGKTWKVLVVPNTGGAPQQVIAGDRNQVDANWSPDGTRIVFGDEWSSNNPAIQILDLKTGETSFIPGSQGLFSPRWSPDGRYITALSIDFTKLMLFDFQTKKWFSWLVEPAGAVSYPSWSADSRYLYFEDLVTAEDSIRRIKVGEAKPESVFVLKGLERYPGPFGLWNARTPDGSQVFVRDRSTQEVYGLDLDLP